MNNNVELSRLNVWKDKRTIVRIITVNGYQMIGEICEFDDCVICVRFKGKKNMVYKNAISTIVPDE